jgi:alpha 1,2-mannosyltransferase
MKPCIVYLAQNTPKDLQYGRDSRGMLEQSLDLFYQNYNNQFHQDILIFHEGDFNHTSQEEVRKGRKEIQFHEIQFTIPEFLNKAEIPEKWDGVYRIGQRHMARFFCYSIFHILNELGYDWFMRLDDDSFIHSKIDYDLFQFMQQNDLTYGYRAMLKEPQRSTFGFSEMVLAYLKAERLKPHSFLEHFDTSLKVNNESFSLKGKIKKLMTNLIDKASEKLRHDLNNWPAATEWNRSTYYNNFLITRLDFWLQPNVQSFLGYFDRVGGNYKYRWSDHIVQTATVQIFLPNDQIYQFTDWTYEHATVKKGQLEWGGIFAGSKDTEQKAIKAFKDKYGKVIHDQ